MDDGFGSQSEDGGGAAGEFAELRPCSRRAAVRARSPEAFLRLEHTRRDGGDPHLPRTWLSTVAIRSATL